MIKECCAIALEEVETAGSTEKFKHLGTEEKGNRLVTSFKCKECSELWTHEAQTEPPHTVTWYPADQTPFN